MTDRICFVELPEGLEMKSLGCLAYSELGDASR